MHWRTRAGMLPQFEMMATELLFLQREDAKMRERHPT